MSHRTTFALGALVALLVAPACPAGAFDAQRTYAKGTIVISPEGGFGHKFAFEHFASQTEIEFFNAGVRFGLVPFGQTGGGPLSGALEIGLEPLFQRYTEPRAFFGGLGSVVRYHFLGLGRVVPYLEVAGFAGGTDLKIPEIQSDFTFLVFGGAGLAVHLDDRTAVYGGYRIEHVSNGGTRMPNRGFESHVGVLGLSFFFH